TAFTAAAIAKTPPMATGLMSWKIAKALYIVPLLFAYTPLIGGSAIEIAQVFFFSLCGLYATSAVFQGHLEEPLNWSMRGALIIAAIAMFWPQALLLNAVGLMAFLAVFFLNVRSTKSTATA
ncbi:MAG: TRAP transporter permease, partial [Pseudomonadota bacterium]